MGTSLYDDYLREQERKKMVGPRRELAPPPARSLYDEYLAEQQTTVPERPSFLSRAGTAVAGLGKTVAKSSGDVAEFLSNPIGASTRIAAERAAGRTDNVVDFGGGIAKGLGQNMLDASQIALDPARAATRLTAETQGNPRDFAVRAGGAASLAMPVLGRAAGLGVKGLAGLDFAASAGLGAAQTPDDPGVGALLGLTMNAVPYVPGAVRGVKDALTPIGPQLGPRAPVRRTVGPRVPDVPLGKAAGKVFPVKAIDMLGEPKTLDGVFDTANPTPAAVAETAFPEGFSTAAREVEADVPTLEQLRAGLPTRRAVEGPEGRRVNVRDVMPLPVIDRVATPPAMRTQFDAPRETPLPGTTERFPDGYQAEPRPAVVPRGALDRVFPEVAKLVNEQSTQLAGNLRDVSVPPNATPFPASNRTFREGFQTPEPNRPATAVPQGDLPAKLFEADAPAGAAGATARAAAMPDGPMTGESLNPALDAAVKTWRAAKLRDSEVQRRFAVVQQFQAALDATNGNVQVAMDAVDSNKDRGLIRLIMGETPKAPPRTVLRAGEAPIVAGNPEGTTKLSSGKSKDFRGYTDAQLAAELRYQHEQVTGGMEMVQNGQWVREGERGMVSGQTREAGRGKAQINRATPLLDAAERELRVRYQRQGLSGEALEDALVRARFGDEAPTPPPAPKTALDPDDYAETGNTDFDFGANVVDAPPVAPPAPPIAAAIPEVPPAAPAAPVGTPAPVAGAVAAPPVAAASAAPAAAPVVDARPAMAPSRDGAINWRTWFDQSQPGAQSAEKIMQDFVAANQPAVKAARGYESAAGTAARANVAATDFFKSLVDDPKNALDRAGIRRFVEQYGEAGVPALKQAIARTAAVMSDAAKAIADPATSADELMLAHRVVDSAFQTQDQLLGGVINEQARIGRSLNALKIQAKLSVDPDVWMIHAKRALGDAPMTDEVMAKVRQLARDAGDACGGG